MSSDNNSNGGDDLSPVGNPDNVEDKVTESDLRVHNNEIEFHDDTSRLKRAVKNITDRYLRRGIQPKRVTPSMFDTIENAVAEGGGRLLRVDPYPENESVAAAEKLLQELHDARMKWLNLVNASDTHGFEIWFNDGKISFYFYVRSERAEKKFKKQIDAYYPDAKITPIHGSPRRDIPKNQSDTGDSDEDDNSTDGRSWWDERFLPIYNGDYVASTRLEKKQSYLYPIRSSKGVVGLDEDPYKAITSEILSDDLDRTMIQVVFRPAGPNWDNGKLGSSVLPFRSSSNDIVQALHEDKLKNSITAEMRPASQEERGLAEKISQYSRRNAYLANIRIVSFSPYKEDARQNVWSLATAFERSYEETAGNGDTQTLTMVPGSGNIVDKMVLRSAQRKWKDCGTILTVPELAAVAHIPNETIETPAVTWNQTGKGSRPPADMPRFDEPPERLPPGVRLNENDDTDSDTGGEDDEEEPTTEDEPVETDEDSEDPLDEPEHDTNDGDASRTDEPASTNEPTSDDESSEDDSTPVEEDSTSQDGIIGATISNDANDTDPFPSHTTSTDQPSRENEENSLTNNTTGEDTEQTTNEDTSPTEPDTPALDAASTNDNDDEDTSSTPGREDPDDESNSTTDTIGMSGGYNKNVPFGSDPDENEETNNE